MDRWIEPALQVQPQVRFYFFDNDVVAYAKKLNPSHRGELEITDIIMQYYKQQSLRVIIMDKGTSWLDTGTVQSLM